MKLKAQIKAILRGLGVDKDIITDATEEINELIEVEVEADDSTEPVNPPKEPDVIKESEKDPEPEGGEDVKEDKKSDEVEKLKAELNFEKVKNALGKEARNPEHLIKIIGMKNITFNDKGEPELDKHLESIRKSDPYILKSTEKQNQKYEPETGGKQKEKSKTLGDITKELNAHRIVK